MFRTAPRGGGERKGTRYKGALCARVLTAAAEKEPLYEGASLLQDALLRSHVRCGLGSTGK